jgi:hypothetical protein
MSVSLALLPVALAVGLTMRLVMGKDKFEAWIESLELKMPTNFEGEADLIRTVKKSGYDAEKWGGSVKTHYNGKQSFLFWELRDGKWVAVFSKYDSKDLILAFIEDLENKSGRQIFVVNKETNALAVLPTATFPTDFRDSEILMQTLADHGLKPVQQDNSIRTQIGSARLLFRQEAGSGFNVEIVDAPDMQGIFNQLLLMDEDYKRYVQTFTYEKVKKHAVDKGLSIESEEVLDDNSILLTLLVND